MAVGGFQVGPFQANAYQQQAGVTVPDVVGELQADGTTTLEGDGFVVSVQTEYSSTVAAGLITRQEPTGGSLASSGSTVTIWVSLGVRPQTEGGGGWVWAVKWEQEQARRRKRRKELEDLEAERERIADAQAREIALFIQEQEAQDARRAELQRLADLVASHTQAKTDSALSDRVQRAIAKAAEKQTNWALLALERELKRAREEEDFILEALRIALDD